MNPVNSKAFVTSLLQSGSKMSSVGSTTPNIPQRYGVHRGLYFGGFDTIEEKKYVKRRSIRSSIMETLDCSSGCDNVCWDFIVPNGYCKKTNDDAGTHLHMYRNTLGCWKTIYTTKGFPSFYPGAFSNMIHVYMICIVVVVGDWE